MDVDNILKNKNRAEKVFFYAFSLVIFAGNILDILTIYPRWETFVFIFNIPSLSIILIANTLFWIRKINLKTAFALILYVVAANSLLSTSLTPEKDIFLALFFRESVFTALLITIAIFFINKHTGYIITAAYLGTLAYLGLLTGEEFLLVNIPIMSIVFISYAIFVAYFSNMLKTTITELQARNETIKKQLEENLAQNEELLQQREEIQAQKDIIEEKNKILNYNNLALAKSEKKSRDLNATKDKFFSIISHDLKNPFNAIMGFSEILEARRQKYTEEKINLYLKIIFNTAKNAYTLLENLLQWARSQTGELEINIKEYDIYETAVDVVSLAKIHAQQKNISVENLILPGTKARYDANMIHTVIRNLVVNAIKFSYNGGTVTIKAIKNSKDIEIHVIDSGTGIKPDKLKKLFKLGKAASSKGTNGEEGTGLGLVLCKDFIEKNHGKIWVESQLDKGSTFFISLPLFKS